MSNNPHDYDSFIDLGIKHAEKDEFDEAVLAFTKANEVNPNRPSSLGFIANIKFRLGKFESAIEFYRQAIELNPDQPEEVYNKLAVALEKLGVASETEVEKEKLKEVEIAVIHSLHWKKGYGSISSDEAIFIRNIVRQVKPKRFLEVGTASGLSTGFIAKFMDELGGGKLLSVDLDTHFWVDRTKVTGFLVDSMYAEGNVDVEVSRGKDTTHLPSSYIDDKFDMAFIDANHQHPWPTLDMFAVMPVLAPKAIVLHHDLLLYKLQTPIFGIGPKYLFDQFPTESKTVTADSKKNIFYIQTPEDYRDIEESLIDSLYLPWTLRQPLSLETQNNFREIIKNHWSERLLDAFEHCLEKFNT